MGVESRSGLTRLFRVSGRDRSTPLPDPEQLRLDGSAAPAPKDPRGEVEFFAMGGVIEEADPRKVARIVNALYLQRFAIEHFADVTPSTTPRDMERYYKLHPDARLFVAKLNGEIVGALTIAPDERIHSVELNRIVRREDKPGLDIGYALGRQLVDRCFLPLPEGFGVSSITVGVILGLKGSAAAFDLFSSRLGFELLKEINDGCDGWSNEQKESVSRKVAFMLLTREKYELMRDMETQEDIDGAAANTEESSPSNGEKASALL